MQSVGTTFPKAVPPRQRALTAWPFRIRPAHRHNEKQDLSHRQRLSRCSSTPKTCAALQRVLTASTAIATRMPVAPPRKCQ